MLSLPRTQVQSMFRELRCASHEAWWMPLTSKRKKVEWGVVRDWRKGKWGVDNGHENTLEVGCTTMSLYLLPNCTLKNG